MNNHDVRLRNATDQLRHIKPGTATSCFGHFVQRAKDGTYEVDCVGPLTLEEAAARCAKQ